jgi:hypothetical protein
VEESTGEEKRKEGPHRSGSERNFDSTVPYIMAGSAAGTIIGGSLAFAALGVLAAVVLYFLFRTARLTKDEVRIVLSSCMAISG